MVEVLNNWYICSTNKLSNESLFKINDMSDVVLVSVKETDKGLEVRIHESAYGNIAMVGLLERIKLTLLDAMSEEEGNVKPLNKKYDA